MPKTGLKIPFPFYYVEKDFFLKRIIEEYSVNSETMLRAKERLGIGF